MILGIVAALPGEMRTITRQRVIVGTLVPLSDTVLLSLSGMGAARARLAGELLLRQGATALLSWGSAGALAAGIQPGNLILPSTIIAANGTVFPVDPAWHERLSQALATRFTLHHGALAEATGVLCNPAAKRALQETSGALAVDMESAALAALAQEYAIPFLTVRAIADSAAMAVPAHLVAIMNDSASLQTLRLAAAVALHAREWRSVVRLARGFHAAQITLKGVMKRTGGTFLAG